MLHKSTDEDFSELQQKLDQQPTSKAAPIQLRIDIFKKILADNPYYPEKVGTKIIRKLFDHDLQFAKSCLADWQSETERAQQALKNLNIFFNGNELPEMLSFAEHAYYCFCISAIITGISLEKLEEEYRKPLKTMVYGVVHPESENWSIQSEFENQDYSKFICHVSKTGLVTIDDINQVTAFRLNKQGFFSGVRITAIVCNQLVEFDGVKEMVVDGAKRATRSLEVLKHDLIHAAFLKRHYERDPTDFWVRLSKFGEMCELVYENNELQANAELFKKVKLALFFWFHEYTTSTFVDGIPESLPKPHARVHGLYANEPQILLRLAAKFNLFPALFANEVQTELNMFKSLKIQIGELEQTEAMSNHDLVKEMMNQLDEGYEFLNTHYESIYDIDSRTHWRGAYAKRIVNDSFIGRGIRSLFFQGNLQTVAEDEKDYTPEFTQ